MGYLHEVQIKLALQRKSVEQVLVLELLLVTSEFVLVQLVLKCLTGQVI